MELVSVIIPAFNAEQTLTETIQSVRGQSYSNLEIIIVDDGSTDRTATIARDFCAIDPRITLISQTNSGVAAARNTAIAMAKGHFIAPIDADDLWHYRKIALQVERFKAGGPRTGLVYSWYVTIDKNNKIIAYEKRKGGEGNVLREMCFRNIVGNGSSPLILTDAVRNAGGYDESLRARGAQGCEDYMLYFRVAERYDFLSVADYLIGYRELSENMSSNVRTMLISRDLCIAALLPDHPAYTGEFQRGRMRLLRFLLARSVRRQRLGDSAWLLREMVRQDVLGTLLNLTALVFRSGRKFFLLSFFWKKRPIYDTCLQTFAPEPTEASKVGNSVEVLSKSNKAPIS